MNYLIRLLVLIGIILGGCKSAPSESLQHAASEEVVSHDDGLPEFDSVDEAIAYVVMEESFKAYRGTVWGSEYYELKLPSGEVTTNWRVNCYFSTVFRKFGTDAFDELAPLLMHEHEFVQVGAYSVLNSYMYAHGLGRHARDTEEERVATMERLKLLLASEDA